MELSFQLAFLRLIIVLLTTTQLPGKNAVALYRPSPPKCEPRNVFRNSFLRRKVYDREDDEYSAYENLFSIRENRVVAAKWTGTKDKSPLGLSAALPAITRLANIGLRSGSEVVNYGEKKKANHEIDRHSRSERNVLDGGQVNEERQMELRIGFSRDGTDKSAEDHWKKETLKPTAIPYETRREEYKCSGSLPESNVNIENFKLEREVTFFTCLQYVTLLFMLHVVYEMLRTWLKYRTREAKAERRERRHERRRQQMNEIQDSSSESEDSDSEIDAEASAPNERKAQLNGTGFQEKVTFPPKDLSGVTSTAGVQEPASSLPEESARDEILNESSASAIEPESGLASTAGQLPSLDSRDQGTSKTIRRNKCNKKQATGGRSQPGPSNGTAASNGAREEDATSSADAEASSEEEPPNDQECLDRMVREHVGRTGKTGQSQCLVASRRNGRASIRHRRLG